MIKKYWNIVDGKKTYIVAVLLATWTILKLILPNLLNEEGYYTIKSILEYLLYGTATHGIYKTINKNKTKNQYDS